MNTRRIVIWTAIAFVAFFLFSNPTGAADIVNSGFGALKQAGTSAQTFMTNILA